MKSLNWRSGLKRLGLLYAACSILGVSWVLFHEPYSLSVCPSSWVISATPDLTDVVRYDRELRERRASRCLNEAAARRQEEARERAKILGLPVLPASPVCRPIDPVILIPAKTVNLSPGEVVSCSFQRTAESLASSPGVRLALLLALIPLMLWMVFRAGRWVWRGFQG